MAGDIISYQNYTPAPYLRQAIHCGDQYLRIKNTRRILCKTRRANDTDLFYDFVVSGFELCSHTNDLGVVDGTDGDAQAIAERHDVDVLSSEFVEDFYSLFVGWRWHINEETALVRAGWQARFRRFTHEDVSAMLQTGCEFILLPLALLPNKSAPNFEFGHVLERHKAWQLPCN